MGSLFEPFHSLEPTLVWGLFTRGLGVVLLISFLSLVGQIVRASGSKGGLPVALRLQRIQRDFGAKRFLYFPTLLWLNRSDTMLRLLTLVGIAASVLIIVGGPWSFWAILTCYLCYLSLDIAIGLIFPWDCLMFEATILALFLPATHTLPNLEAVAVPAPALAWVYRLAVLRVLLGFGKLKFVGATSKDWAYLRGFLVAQPLPSPLGWYAQKMPLPLLRSMVVFMFIVEIPAPIFAMVPGDLSIVAAVLITMLMIGIQAMGSFGYFSILTIVACIPLFDNVTPRALELGHLFAPGQPVFMHAVLLVHTLGAIIVFPANSWVGQNWHLWATWFRFPVWLRWPIAFFRLLHPFRWLHPYGVFPPNTYPGVKISLLVEVSWDEKQWHELEFEFSPSNPMSRPKFIAPYHPRGDQAVIYETFGLNPTSLISSTAGPWEPYSYGTQPAANVLLQRVLEGKGAEFMKPGPLAEHDEPPLSARITTVLLEPVSLKEHRETGRWWKRTYMGPHAPPRRRDPDFWEHFLPEPEMWHWDSIVWRQRSRMHGLMNRARAGEDPMQLALALGPGLSSDDVDRFWNELIPALSPGRTDWETLPDAVADMRARYSRAEREALYRMLGRFSMFLVAKLEPMYLGRGLKPEIPATTYFHLWMVAQHIIAQGREAYEEAMASPKEVVTRELETMTVQSGLYLLSVFRFEPMCFEAQKLRLITCFMPPHDGTKPTTMEELDPYMALVARVAETWAGFFSVMNPIREGFQGPRFDQGYPERHPRFKQLDTGEVMLASYGDEHDDREPGAAAAEPAS
jgi:hypothetical protein